MTSRSSKAAAILLACASLQACISVEDSRTLQVGKADAAAHPKGIQIASFDGLKIQSVIYRPAEFPLSVFFKRLARGDFKEGLRRMNLRYVPSNADSKALKFLLKNGFVPVLITAANTGSEPLDLGRVKILLKSPDQLQEPIANADLPQSFEKLNWAAVGANAYNAPLAVIGVTTLLAAAFVGFTGDASTARELGLARPKTPVTGTYTVLNVVAPVFDQISLDNEPWNSVTKTTNIDYSSYLLTPRSLGAGESASGLLFFRMKSKRVDWPALRIEVQKT